MNISNLMDKSEYQDPDESLGKHSIRIEKSNVEYYTVKSKDNKTIEKTNTYEQALEWVESQIEENYSKPVANRHRFFRRSQLMTVTGDQLKFKILKVQEIDKFIEYTVG